MSNGKGREDAERNERDEPDDLAGEVAREAESPEPGLLLEFRDFLRHNKKWWLTPLILMILLTGLLILLAGTVGPLIYPGL